MTLATIKPLVVIQWIIFTFICISSALFIPKHLTTPLIALTFVCALFPTIVYFHAKKQNHN